jgi:uncharacterized membrane protein
MEMLLIGTSLAAEAACETGTGVAASVGHFVNSMLALLLPVLKAVGAFVILWGVCCAAVRLVRMEIKMIRGQEYQQDAALIRQHLGYYLLLGLNFIIALDVVETLLHPSWQELAILAGLVILRTVMGFALQLEMREIKEELQEQSAVQPQDDE